MLWLFLVVIFVVMLTSVVIPFGLLPHRVQLWCCRWLDWHRAEPEVFKDRWLGHCQDCGAWVWRDQRGSWLRCREKETKRED
jgi:hypothetical protein